MQPIARETIVERRQPYLRWSAVFAGAAVAGGAWLLLQLIFTGTALLAVDPSDAEHAATFYVGATVGSFLAPLVAMFLGGMLAGRLAAQYEKRIAGLHGVLVWCFTAILGLVGTGLAVGALVDRSTMSAHTQSYNAPAPGTGDYLESAIAPASEHMQAQGAPGFDKDDVVAASRTAVTNDGRVDRDAFVANLDAETKLSRPEAEAAVTQLGAATPDVVTHAHRLAKHREHAAEMANAAGKTMLLAGIALLFGLFAAVGGALVGRRTVRRPFGRDTMPGHTTAPYPLATDAPTIDPLR